MMLKVLRISVKSLVTGEGLRTAILEAEHNHGNDELTVAVVALRRWDMATVTLLNDSHIHIREWLMRSYLSLGNYWLLMNAREGVVIVLSSLLTCKHIMFQWIIPNLSSYCNVRSQ